MRQKARTAGTTHVVFKGKGEHHGLVAENNQWKLNLKSKFTKGPFTNYVYKRRGVGGQKNRFFVNLYTIENVNRGGYLGGQKKTNLVNIVCERPLTTFGGYYS